MNSVCFKNDSAYLIFYFWNFREKVDNGDSSCIETHDFQEKKKEIEYAAKGRRVVEIGFFLQQLSALSQHGPFGCSFSDMILIDETQKGLNCGLKFQCRVCNYSNTVWTNSAESTMLDINTAAVLGITEIGCGFSNLEEFTSILNIPPMSSNKFLKEQSLVCSAWEQAAALEIEAAVAEEKRLAVEAGDVDSEGYPLITVVADGSWAKRSYRSNYSSLSGAVSIFNILSYHVCILKK